MTMLFSLSLQEKELYKSINLTQSLTEVFVTIGETAYKTETPVCFFVDEIQYMRSEELGSLIAALHRTNQLGYPVMIIGADCLRYIKCYQIRNHIRKDCFCIKKLAR